MSPELTLRPSLSELEVGRMHAAPLGVAGANAPAFVERSAGRTIGLSRHPVSPELTLRPSLSAVVIPAAFSPEHVSPELTLRPSLSVP